jgi:erythromycin esterase
MKILIYIFGVALLVSWSKKNSGDQHLLRKYCTFSSDTSYTDAASLCKIFPENAWDNRRVIGCGQSSHGSHENFQIQKLIFEFMAEKKGCRLFIMEASYSSLLEVNKYVTENAGTKDSILHDLGFWVWQTEEVWEMIEWTRNFNSHRIDSDKILFLGNDMQDMPASSRETLKFLTAYNPSVVKEATNLMQPFLVDSVFNAIKYTPEIVADYNGRIKKICDWVEQADAPEKESNTREYKLGKRNGELMAQTFLRYQGSFGIQYARRDSMMAENVKWIVDHNL